MKKKQPSIQTKRMLLRPFTIEDAPRVKFLLDDPNIADTTQYIPYPYQEGYAETWIEPMALNYEQGWQMMCAMELKETNEVIGSIGLDFIKENESATMGYWVGSHYWNQGYATEAAKGMIAYAFRVLDLHRVKADHMVRNPSSGRVMIKAGMTYEGTERESRKIRGVFESLATYAILKQEYLKMQLSKN